MTGTAAPQTMPGIDVGDRPGPDSFRVVRFLSLIPGFLIGVAMIWGSSVDLAGRRVFTLVDDALISMTYARTYATTGELVWFPGADRVEGFTNPGYTLIMTIPHALGFSPSAAALALSCFGLATVLGAAFLAGGLAARILATSLVAVVTTAVSGVVFPLLYWSVFGLEVGLVTALLLSTLVIALRGRASGFPVRTVWVLAGVFAAGVLVRPDFIVGAIVVGAWVVANAPAGTGRVTRAVILAAGSVGTLLLLTVIRFGYYGAFTPNTYDLKVANSTLLQRVSRAWVMDTEALWLLGFTALALVALTVAGSATRWSPAWLVAALGASQIAYVYYVGGDTFHPNRFLVPATLCTIVLVIPAAATLPRRGIPAGVIAAVSALLASVVLWRTLPSGWNLVAVAPAVSWLVAAVSQRWGRVIPALPMTAGALAILAVTAGNDVAGYRGWWLDGAALWPMDRIAVPAVARYADFTSADAVVAVYGAGAIPYWVGRPAVDLLGKSDRLVARQERRDRFIPGHDKWDYTHSILELRPDVIDGDLLNPADPVTRFFPPTPSELDALSRDYLRLCRADGTPVTVRKDSENVDFTALVRCR